MAISFPSIAWSKGANIYEVNVRQYTPQGTFNAFAQHLPRLRDMGVEILWFMPITPISLQERQGTLGSYYACSSYTQINPEYGTLADFKKLVETAQEMGFKVIIDWVANHTGWDHHWTTEHPDWYVKDAEGNFTEVNGWADVIDLDFSSRALRKEMIECMKFWVNECGIDGFRCDMAHLIPLDFWKDARTACDAIKPLYWLAESDVVAYHEVFDTIYSWWWMHASEKYFKGNAHLDHVWDILYRYSEHPEDTSKLFFTSNHDENSWNGSEYEKYGNAAKAMAVFTCTWQGLSLMYSGQENPNYKRLKFFEKDQIDWNEPPLLHNFYKTLLTLRNNNAIRHGQLTIIPTYDNNHVMAFIRKHDDDVVLVILNFSNQQRSHIVIEHEWLRGRFQNVFSHLQFNFNNKEQFEVQANEFVVYERLSEK